MTRYDRRLRVLAACLSAVAGYVDALGFIKLGGFFVSFMSGNSTRVGVGAAEGSVQALLAAGLIGTFVLGVVAGSILGAVAGAHRRVAVLSLVTILLAIGASLACLGHGELAVVAMGLAMGAENAAFERNGEVSIGLTYMTGTLVKFGQKLASLPFGGDRLAWAPYLLLWLGLVSGALAGAAVYPHLGLNGLWLAVLALAALAVAAGKIGPDEESRQRLDWEPAPGKRLPPPEGDFDEQ